MKWFTRLFVGIEVLIEAVVLFIAGAEDEDPQKQAAILDEFLDCAACSATMVSIGSTSLAPYSQTHRCAFCHKLKSAKDEPELVVA